MDLMQLRKQYLEFEINKIMKKKSETTLQVK